MGIERKKGPPSSESMPLQLPDDTVAPGDTPPVYGRKSSTIDGIPRIRRYFRIMNLSSDSLLLKT
jgi:hypothetical protein